MEPGIMGMKNMLNAAMMHESVKGIVYTSGCGNTHIPIRYMADQVNAGYLHIMTVTIKVHRKNILMPPVSTQEQ